MAVRPDRMVPVELVDDDDEVVGPSTGRRTSAELLAWARQVASGGTGSTSATYSAGVAVGAGAAVSVTTSGALGAPAAAQAEVRSHGPSVRWVVSGVVLGAITVFSLVTTHSAADQPPAATVLAEPLRDAWAASADEVLAVHDGTVLVQSAGTRQQRLRALDEVTGDELWSVPLGSRGPADLCEPGVTTDPPTVWCWRDPHWNPDPQSGRLAITPQALVGVDATSGEVVVEREVDAPLAGWSVEGDDIVFATRDGRDVRIDRLSPADWEPVWSTTITLEHQPRVLRQMMWLEVTEGFAVVHGATTAVLDAADGRVLGIWTATLEEEGTLLDGAEVATTGWGFAAWSSAVEGVRMPRGTWYDRTGQPVGEIVGRLVEPDSNDGSVPEVLLVTRDGGKTLVATSVETGSDLWQLPIEGGSVVARHGGRAVVTTGNEISSYEVLTGARAWTRPVEGLHPEMTGVSDGSTVVVFAVRSHHWTALAYRLSDGGLLWSATVPGTGEIGLIPRPPAMKMLGDVPLVWLGRTLVWIE